MSTKSRGTLAEYLTRAYPLRVDPDPDGGYVIDFPDLPGCMTQVDRLSEVSTAAEEIRTLWLRSAYEQGFDIPEPTYPEEHSGKFNLRLPKSLHRRLVQAANADGVSLNQYVVMLLAQGHEASQAARVLARLEEQ